MLVFCNMLTATSTLLSGIRLSDAISILALVASILAIGWNIVRDLIVDRVKINIQATVGGLMMYADKSGQGFFRDIDSTYTPTKNLVGISITNVGRRPVMLSKIHGRYKNSVDGKLIWIYSATKLPKLLQPYETLMEIMNDDVFIDNVKKDNLEHLCVQDTKGHSWKLTRKAMDRLKDTALLTDKKNID